MVVNVLVTNVAQERRLIYELKNEWRVVMGQLAEC